MRREPRRRTGENSLPNVAALDAARRRSESGAKFRVTKEPRPAVADPAEGAPAPSAQAPTAADGARTPPEASVVTPAGTDREISFRVRILPEQRALLETIAARLDASSAYVETVLRRAVLARLRLWRDTNAWSEAAQDAQRRMLDDHGHGQHCFRASVLLKPGQETEARRAANDRLEGLASARVIGGFARAAFDRELAALDLRTARS